MMEIFPRTAVLFLLIFVLKESFGDVQELNRARRKGAGTPGAYHIGRLMEDSARDIARRGAFPLNIITDPACT